MHSLEACIYLGDVKKMGCCTDEQTWYTMKSYDKRNQYREYDDYYYKAEQNGR
jgi:hypothetical protein